MDLVGTPGYALQELATAMHRYSDQLLQERLGIGMSQYKLLMLLEAYPNTGQRRLADLLSQTEASVSRQIKLVCDKGMAARTIKSQDHRERVVAITPKGLKLVYAAHDLLERYDAGLFAPLGEKRQKQFMEDIETMRRGLA